MLVTNHLPMPVTFFYLSMLKSNLYIPYIELKLRLILPWFKAFQRFKITVWSQEAAHNFAIICAIIIWRKIMSFPAGDGIRPSVKGFEVRRDILAKGLTNQQLIYCSSCNANLAFAIKNPHHSFHDFMFNIMRNSLILTQENLKALF